jgi:conjugal transfer/type IV secretion protein DotA/TraY
MPKSLDITKGDVARYILLPQIFPRIKKLFTSGLGSLPYFIIVFFNTVRIIPNKHPYLLAANHKKYSLFQALGAAADNITFNRKNIDKIAIFGLVLTGIVMMILQIILFIMAMFAAPAYAAGTGPTTISGFFKNDNPETDIAFRLLDLVFGLPGIYNTSVATTPFHTGLHALFEFYSFGMLIIGTLIIIYLAVCVVLETAESGVPFGQRFNKAWVPIRIVLFFGLLLPTPNGINLAQYLVLNAAKLGSNVATNAWLTFDKTLNQPYLGTPDQLIAKPNLPDLDSFAGFMAIARTCSFAEGRVNGRDIRPYVVSGPNDADAIDMSSATPAFTDMVKKAQGGTISVKFGEKDANLYKGQSGAVFPYCGELAMPVLDQNEPGAAIMQQAYIEMIGCLWAGRAGSAIGCSQPSFSDMGRDFTKKYIPRDPPEPFPNMDPYIGDTQKMQILIQLNTDFTNALDNAVNAQVSGSDWTNAAALPLGWGGAGIWFNKIAEQNGAMTSAVMAVPQIRKMPDVMEEIRRLKLKKSSDVPFAESYTPLLPGDDLIDITPEQQEISRALDKVMTYWGSEEAIAWFKDQPATNKTDLTGNIIIDTINVMMGTRGLFDMCKNNNVHPLAKLSALGRGLVEHSIRSFGIAAGVGVGAGVMAILEQQNISGILKSATSFFVTFGAIGLILGFLLFYVLPFLPFIYFFFAIMTWVKGIFEAMVGMPLWALAHLRIDGEGMPGDAAESGYFYILEIFLRPICILIGFLGGILIFGAMVKVLNEIFYLALSNLAGHSTTLGTGCFQPPAAAGATSTPTGSGGLDESLFKRGVVDEFFYTVMYTIIVYLTALPCFKLVDAIPDNIMRWLGTGISSFGSQDGDPAEGVMSYVSAGAGTIGKQLDDAGEKGFGISS